MTIVNAPDENIGYVRASPTGRRKWSDRLRPRRGKMRPGLASGERKVTGPSAATETWPKYAPGLRRVSAETYVGPVHQWQGGR
jgi:hypothetical protein